MATPEEGTPEETQLLLTDDKLLGTNSLNADATDPAQSLESPQPEESQGSLTFANMNRARAETIVHYSSISVGCRQTLNKQPLQGSVQIIERDVGAANDFWNIEVNFIWKPRGFKLRYKEADASTSSFIEVSVDDFLTLRLNLSESPPSIIIHKQGGALLGEFLFPNGPDAAMAFLTELRVHVVTIPIADEHKTGELFVVEKKQRMRRVAPSLMASTSSAGDDDFVSLLQDLNISSRTATGGNRRGGTVRRARDDAGGSQGELGMTILAQFAKITKVAREIGEDLSVFLDEKKRKADSEQREHQRAARRRALDIYADIVASTDVERELPPRMILDEPRGVPVSACIWAESFDDFGRLVDPAVLKQAVFSGGVDPAIRSLVWPFILGFYEWDSSQSERDGLATEKKHEYDALKKEWSSLQAAAQAEDRKSLLEVPEAITVDRRTRVSKPHSDYLETEEQIAKDIVRTDRKMDFYKQDDAPATLVMGTLLNVYAVYDNRITYCQGMSDFLSPILFALGINDESLVFWCFVSLMRHIEENFRIDQTGMRRQLTKLKRLVEVADSELAQFFEQSDPDYYCCFRWILVRFKRELPFDATARMWEVLWTQQVGGNELHIFVAGALLKAHRRQLLSLPIGAFDSLLRYVNDMSMRIDVDFALREGQLCFRNYSSLMLNAV